MELRFGVDVPYGFYTSRFQSYFQAKELDMNSHICQSSRNLLRPRYTGATHMQSLPRENRKFFDMNHRIKDE